MTSKEESKKKAAGSIDGVEPAKDFHESTGGKWISVFKAFNPFGPVGEMYSKTLAYKIESKRLDVELTRINRQADIYDKAIDKAFQLKMEELSHRRIALIGFYAIVNAELERAHIERVKVLEMAQFAQQKSFESGLSIEERKLFSEMSMEMTKQLPIFGNNSNESLQKLVQALPSVEISPKLLPE